MAFTIDSFLPQRASQNCFLTNTNIATHSYISQDTITTISNPNYFPPYFGIQPGVIKIGDFIEISSFGSNSPIQNELNFNYKIIALDPVVIEVYDPFYYNVYPLPYIGAATGINIFSFSRNSGGNVTVLMINNQDFNIISANTINFIFDLNLRDRYLPDPTAYPSGFFGSCIASFGAGAPGSNPLNIEFRIINGQMSFADTPNSPFAVGNVISLFSPSFQYQGKPLS